MNAQIQFGNTQLTDQQSKGIQAAIGSFVQPAAFDLNAGVVFAATDDDERFRSTTVEMTVFGDGAAEC